MTHAAPSTTPRDALIDRFLVTQGWHGAARAPLKGDASFRRYERIRHSQLGTAMLMDAPPEREDVRPYLRVADYLAGCGFSTPRILGCDEGQGLLLLEDLGDDSYTAVLAGRASLKETYGEPVLYREAIRVLVKMRVHTHGAALPAYDTEKLLQEVALFTDWFMPLVAGEEKAAALREEYLSLWRSVIEATPWGAPQCVHRDYHADNLMWLPEREGARRVGLLDFQDALAGDAAYDLVSLLEDARRDIAPSTVQDMLDFYLSETGEPRDAFMQRYAVLGAQRNSKIVGIFCRLSRRDNKPHYLAMLPRIWGHLARDLAHPALTPIRAWIDAYVPQHFRGVLTHG